MAICQKCGMMMADGMRFCGYCGAAVVQPGGQAQPPYGVQPGGQAQPPYGVQPDGRAQPPAGSLWEMPQGYGNYGASPGPQDMPRNPFRSADGPDSRRTGSAGLSQPAVPASAAKGGGFTISLGSRIIKTLICLAIAAAIVTGVVIFFEIDLHYMDGYSRMVSRTLTSQGWFTAAINENLGKIAVYGLAAMIVLGAFMLPARISGTVMKTIGIGDKVVVVLAGYFLIAFFFLLKQYVVEERAIARMWRDVMRAHGGERFVNLLLFLLLIVLLLIPVAFIIWSLKVLIGVVIGNIIVNGPVLGIIGAAYELLSAVFTTALVLCAFAFGMAIILLPLIILLACQGGRRVVCIDGVYYYVD